MNKVEEFLNIAARSYYAGSPIITDNQFDNLAESTGYNTVGAKQHGHIEAHYYPMYSLQKHYEDEGVNPLANYTNKTSTPKLDGAAIDLLYINGVLVRVLTRGDGKEGTVVTDKFLETNLVPHSISLPGIVQITGEIAAPSHVENARNYAAGALNLGSVDEFRTRAVAFFAYSVTPTQTDTYRKDMKVLTIEGFETVYSLGITEVYPTDGLVIRLNNNKEFEAMGFTSKFPRGAYALKVRGKAVETTLLDVEWQVGKSGKVTPVAILAPILIGDAVVSRATLNNGAFIAALGLYIGCTVGVVRSGEIIPQITYMVDA